MFNVYATANFAAPSAGESFDEVEWIGLDEENGKKLIEKYNKEGKEAGFNQQPVAKRSRFDNKSESNRNIRDSRNNRDNRRNNCECCYLQISITTAHSCKIYCLLYCIFFWIKIKTEVATLCGVALVWEVGEETDRKGAVIWGTPVVTDLHMPHGDCEVEADPQWYEEQTEDTAALKEEREMTEIDMSHLDRETGDP